MLRYIYQISMFQSFFVALFCYNYIKGSYMKWFLPFLGLMSILNLTAFMTDDLVYLFNMNYIQGISASVFYGYIFYHISVSQLLKRVIVVFISINIAGYLVAYFFLDLNYKFLNYFLYNLMIFGFGISAIALLCLYLIADRIEKTMILWEPDFWIAFGTALFYSGVSITFSLYDVIIRHNLIFLGLRLYNSIPQVLCLPLYLSISISIILSKRRKSNAI
jgi:hypothetical protein